MPNTTGFEPGNIVLVPFPFTNLRGSKQRPAVVIASVAYNQSRPDVVPMTVTGRIRRPLNFGESVIDDWRAAGLPKPSAIKPVLFTMEQQLAIRTLGRLGERDRAALVDAIQSVVGSIHQQRRSDTSRQ